MSAPSLSANLTTDDLSLVVAMATGEERAAALLSDRHGAVMFGLAIRMVGEAADAEEVVLDAFAQAWREAVRYDTTRGSVLGWLTTIVRTRALDTIRARGRRARMVDAATTRLDEPAAMGEGAPLPDAAVEGAERAGAVSSALRSLPDPQRRAIELAFFEGLTHQEVAERLREPLGTVKTRIRLGMLKLRDMLGGFAPEPAS
ncbi:MAG: sigma-70 family RNA polymerase sigma factor [Gemmatimonas sp.]